MNTRSIIALSLCTIVLLSAALACASEVGESLAITRDKYYLIKPADLLQSLANGMPDAFTEVEQRPELLPPAEQIPVDWTQGDYLYIAQALHEHVWGETLDGWQLHKMDFRLGCDDVNKGFQNGRFEYFKVVGAGREKSRITRSMDIDPRGNFVNAWESEYRPNVMDWIPIDLAQLQISVDNALQIAEVNGGQKQRSLVENSCEISLAYSPDTSISGDWEIFYTRSDDGSRLMHLRVDPDTGEVKIR
jgi:hypothetical protein